MIAPALPGVVNQDVPHGVNEKNLRGQQLQQLGGLVCKACRGFYEFSTHYMLKFFRIHLEILQNSFIRFHSVWNFDSEVT